MGGDTYTHGHHQSVVAMHATRTAQTCAAFLLPRLRPGLDLLDVGCGPGSITVGLEAAVTPGRVVALDVSAEVVAQAAAASTSSGVDWRVGDVYDLDFPDGSFDVVFAHMVLQHLTAPAAALGEMHRVLRPGGVVAVRDSDYASFTWSPENPGLTRWLDLYHQVCRRNGAEPDAGRHLLRWVNEAGFGDVVATASATCYADPPGRSFWGGGWTERALKSAFATQAVDYGLATPDELESISAAWRSWTDEPTGWFAYLVGEAVGVKPFD